jgi:hypothetical protein
MGHEGIAKHSVVQKEKVINIVQERPISINAEGIGV